MKKKKERGGKKSSTPLGKFSSFSSTQQQNKPSAGIHISKYTLYIRSLPYTLKLVTLRYRYCYLTIFPIVLQRHTGDNDDR